MSVFWHFFKWLLGIAPPEVWTSPAERACLVRYARGKRRLVEVGVWHGGTSRELRGAMARDGVLYAVDPYPPGRLGISLPRIVGRRELKRITNGRVEWIREVGSETATSGAMREAAPFDFVFVDAAQTYELLESEWQAWAPLVASEGIIALHDSLHCEDATTPEQTSVAYAREVIFPDPRFALIDRAETLAVLQRRGTL